MASADSSDTSISAGAQGLSLAGFAGWKWMADFGLTFVVQGGAAYMALAADAKDSDTGETAKKGDSKVGVLLNLDLGWSF